MALSNELKILISAAIPVIELRYSVPYGILFLKESLLKTYLLAVLGNMLPVIPILVFLKPVSEKLRKFPIWDKLFNWLFNRAKEKSALVEKYEILGLMVFVAIPLPGTGAWTGCVVASLFKMRFRYAFISILLGVALAGLMMVILSVTGNITCGKLLPKIIKLINNFS